MPLGRTVRPPVMCSSVWNSERPYRSEATNHHQALAMRQVEFHTNSAEDRWLLVPGDGGNTCTRIWDTEGSPVAALRGK